MIWPRISPIARAAAFARLLPSFPAVASAQCRQVFCRGLVAGLLLASNLTASSVMAADIVCRSITEALDLLLDERLLIATLRA